MKRILGIIAGVGIVALINWVILPDFLLAINRSRQKRTMADIRAIASAWEARAEVTKSYSVTTGRAPALSQAQLVPPAELSAALTPTYIRRMPRNDAWRSEYQFTVSSFDASGRAQSYEIRSFGSDGRPDHLASAAGATHSFAADIVYADGSFIQYPEEAG